MAAASYELHRLKFVHVEDDGELLFVCICLEGFDRHGFNCHIRDKFAEATG